jgi:hypothetical protein
VRERDRYQRAGFRQSIDEFFGWFPAHPSGSTGLALVAATLIALRILTPSPLVAADLHPGECLYVRPPGGSGVMGRQGASTDLEVGIALANGGVEQASCSGSHSHEVVAVLVRPEAAGTPLIAEVAAAADASCRTAAVAYLGLPDGSTGSSEVLAGLPTETAWNEGSRTLVCLVGAPNGAFTSTPARAAPTASP